MLTCQTLKEGNNLLLLAICQLNTHLVSSHLAYFHDGTEPELKEAVCKMATYQVGVELTDSEEEKIFAFLESLTGEHNGVLLTNDNMKK
jgi:hypothetical protein